MKNRDRNLYYWSMLTRQVTDVQRAHVRVTDSGMDVSCLDALLAAVEQLAEGCSRTYDWALEVQSPGVGGTGGVTEPPLAGARPGVQRRRASAAGLTADHDRATPHQHAPEIPQESEAPPEDWSEDFDASVDALCGP